MSFQTFVTERLAAITSLVNAISTNAKKIDELPVQNTLDLSSKIHVSKNGESQSLEVSKIIEAISNGNYDQILNIGQITIAGNVVTIPSGAIWRIDDVNYTSTADTLITIPLTATGLNRTDIIIANNLGQIILEQGIETAGIAVRPNIPLNSILVTQIDVNDSNIGDTTPPIVGAQFVEKIEYLDNFLTSTGIISIPLQNKNTSFVLTENVDEVLGFDMTNDFFTSSFYIGKELRVENQTGASFLFKHNGGTNLPALFPLETDFIVNDKDILIFKPQKYLEFGAKLISVNRTFFEIEDINELEAVLNNKENSNNKVITMTGNTTSNVVFLSAKALYDWAVGKFQDLLVSGTNIKTINGLSILGSGDFIVAKNEKSIRMFFNSWNLTIANTWRSWSRNTSNMLVSDANSSCGTGIVPSDATGAILADINFILVSDVTKLNKLSLSIRDCLTPVTIELFIRTFNLVNGGFGRGTETNSQTLIHQSFITAGGSSNFFKNDFTIASHTLSDKTGMQIAYRTISGSAAQQGINLKFDFE